MGYVLTDELLANRPPSPGPEWWLLMDLAADADDRTRRTMPGMDYMARRTRAPERTIYRWLKKLHEDGLITTVEKAAGGSAGRKGKRAVYEIQVPPRLAARAAGHLSLLPPDGRRVGESGATGGQETELVGNSGDSCHQVAPDSPESGSLLPPAVAPPIEDPFRRAPVEGAWLRPDQDRSDEGKNEDQKHTLPQREARRAPAA